MTNLEGIKLLLVQLPRDQQISVEKCAAIMRQLIEAFEVNGKLALALVGAEAEQEEGALP